MERSIPTGNAIGALEEMEVSWARKRKSAAIPDSRGARGFTLIEMMVVIFIIMVLATIAVGKYFKMVTRAREAVLRSDLKTLRDSIENYTRDKEAPPSALDDLVAAGYLTQLPKDPFTNSPDWVTDSCDTLLSPEQTTIGICTVHSASNEVSPFDNTPYSSW